MAIPSWQDSPPMLRQVSGANNPTGSELKLKLGLVELILQAIILLILL